MRQENLQMLISFIKLKKLHISEMKNSITKLKTDEEIVGVYASMIQILKTEIKILNGIIKSEEKNDGSR